MGININKHYIDANRLLVDAYELGLQVLESGYRPNYVVGIWRGGAPVAIAVHELLWYCGVEADHTAIQTAHYTGINQTGESVAIQGLDYLTARVGAGDRLLIVDDVFDTGLSIERVIDELQRRCGGRTPALRTAMPWFKPGNNRTALKPDYYLHETEDWLVFPHELDGLSAAEVMRDKPALGKVRERIARRGRSG